MTHQVALTIRAKVKPGETEDLKDLLSIVGADIERNEIVALHRRSPPIREPEPSEESHIFQAVKVQARDE